VVERDFGEQLLELATRRHVWIAETTPNRAAAERVWAVIDGDRNEGVTTFEIDTSLAPEAWVVDVLDVVDEHHGLRSEWASDVELEVRGVSATAAIRQALDSLGTFELEEHPNGFVARRRPAV
jgi:hypothetical protein